MVHIALSTSAALSSAVLSSSPAGHPVLTVSGSSIRLSYSICFTQVSNYKHHWSDVLVGFLVGSTIGIFVALFVAEVFKRREIPACLPPNDFGLIRMEKRTDVNPAVTTATHSFTVTNEQDPASNRL
ncbi:hypothetical protein OESDEN_25266 [Oesophagostomum dentatum]|uniref:Phosphatidic acid phosphatase type 2/haloperoxidase domain-containing protein n=1 Tax=Oesophagostomum dentatum TaxID=61180 RepID=A0A0B1RPY5_OESDE|nr:hypothetical protein OESDEN_25266 [Oesophagostomum dentatum]